MSVNIFIDVKPGGRVTAVFVGNAPTPTDLSFMGSSTVFSSEFANARAPTRSRLSGSAIY